MEQDLTFGGSRCLVDLLGEIKGHISCKYDTPLILADPSFETSKCEQFMAPSQKLILVPGAKFRGNRVFAHTIFSLLFVLYGLDV